MPNQPTIRFDLPRTFRTPGAPSRQGPRRIGSTGTSGAFSLASALSSLNPAIQNSLQAGFDFYQESERARADEFSRNYQGDYAEAVRKGDLPAGASVFFREQVVRNEVKQKAHSYQTWLAAQWHNDADIKGADEDQFEAWVQAQTSDYVNTELSGYNSRILSEEFDGLARNAQNNLASHHLADGFRRTKQRGLEAINNGVLDAVRQTAIEDPKVLAQEFVDNGGDIGGIQREYEIRERVALQRIQQLMDDGYASGLTYQELNKSVVDSVALLAEQTGDTSVFGILDQIQTGTGKLSGTRYAQGVQFDTELRVSQRQMTELRNRWAIEDRMKAEAEEQAWASLVRNTVSGEGDVTGAVEEFIAAYPEQYSRAVAWANALGKPLAGDGPGGGDGQVFLELKDRAQIGDLNSQEIIDTALAGNINTSQATHLMDELQSTQRNTTADLRSQGTSFRADLIRQVQDPVYKQATPEQERNALEMQRVYMQTIRQRRDEGKPMTPLEELDLRDQLTQRFLQKNGTQNAFQEGRGAAPAGVEVPPVDDAGGATEGAQEASTASQPATPVIRRVEIPGGISIEVPENHIQYLWANASDPQVLNQFDEQYGVGAAAALLLPDLQ